MTPALPLSRHDIRLIPKPLWGYSLAALCLASSWNPIRSECIVSAGSSCAFADRPGRHDGTLEAHERWNYSDTGVVTLEGIWPLCRHCHELFHPGRVLAHAGRRGLERLTHRYAATAGIDRADAKRRYDTAFRNHSTTSKIPKWTIDASLVAAHFPLKAKRAKQPAIETHIWRPNPFVLGN